LLRNVVSNKFDSLYKILTSGKKRFSQCLQYFASPDVCRWYFKKKTHPDWVLIIMKINFSSVQYTLDFCGARETFGGFWPLELPKLPEGGIWKF
jgi:hypothetical protein